MKYNHFSVLEEEVLSYIDDTKPSIVLDATLGLGGHTLSILKNKKSVSNVYCIDQDKNSILVAKERLEKYSEKIKFINDNFKNVNSHIHEKVDYIIADLGVSTYQIMNMNRGFSFNSQNRLDMRMDRSQVLDAYQVVNSYSVNRLSEILKDYGEEKNHYKIANQICRYRERKDIFSCKELSDLVSASSPGGGRLNSSTRTFMALRIEVNNELECLKEFLNKSIEILNSGGKLIIISFHSLEDRIVKNFMKHCEKNCVCETTKLICDCKKKSTLKILTKKPIRPSQKEILVNPNSRSAKLRVGAII